METVTGKRQGNDERQGQSMSTRERRLAGGMRDPQRTVAGGGRRPVRTDARDPTDRTVDGQTVVVVAILISTFLGALAVGYAWGARSATEHSAAKAAHMLLLAAAITAVLASRPGADWLLAQVAATRPGVMAGTAVYAIALVLPVALCTGRAVVLMAAPFEGQGTRRGAATILAWSTWGNVAGGLATPLIVMHLLGTEAAVALATTCLGAAAVLCAPSATRAWIAILIATGAWLAAGVDTLSGHFSSAYARYVVTQAPDGSNILWTDEAAASRHDADGRGWAYTEHIEDALWEEGSYRLADGARIAVLGAAGMTLGEGRSRRLKRTFVDVEPHTTKLARRLRSDASTPDAPLIIADARAWIAHETGRWDAIVLDLFNGRYTPAHVMTVQWFAQVRRALRPRGVMAMNLIVATPPQRFARRIDNTVRRIFAECSVTDVSDPDARQGTTNRVYLCRESEHDTDRTIYRDTRSQAQSDAYDERARAGPLDRRSP